MEAVKRLLLVCIASTLLACAHKPVPTPIVIQQEKPRIERPVLDIENLTDDSNAADVFKAYQTSLLQCVGYAKQLEAFNE